MDFPLIPFEAGALSTLALVLLPVLFNRYVLPVISEQARLRKYLRIINAAAESYRSEFPKAFDSPDKTWRDYASQVLVQAANAQPMAPNDKTWALAQRIFLNHGPGVDLPAVLEP